MNHPFGRLGNYYEEAGANRRSITSGIATSACIRLVVSSCNSRKNRPMTRSIADTRARRATVSRSWCVSKSRLRRAEQRSSSCRLKLPKH